MAEIAEVTAETVETTADATSTTQPATPAAVDLADYEKVKAALKEANRESAERRVKLAVYEKAETDRATAELTELERVKLEAANHQTKAAEYEKELAQLKAEKAFSSAEKKLSIAWVNETAREDAIKMIGVVASEDVEKELKRVTVARPHWLKTIDTPNLDATATGSQSTAPNDAALADIRKRYIG